MLGKLGLNKTSNKSHRVMWCSAALRARPPPRKLFISLCVFAFLCVVFLGVAGRARCYSFCFAPPTCCKNPPQNDSKILPTSTPKPSQKRLQDGLKMVFILSSLLNANLLPAGSNLGPTWGPSWRPKFHFFALRVSSRGSGQAFLGY